jgi:hypothetical protein
MESTPNRNNERTSRRTPPFRRVRPSIAVMDDHRTWSRAAGWADGTPSKPPGGRRV